MGKREKKRKTKLEGPFVRLSPQTYPGRLYGKYDWDWDKKTWVINKEWQSKYEHLDENA